MIKNIKAITASSYLSMFFLGVGVTVLGAAARDIGLSPFQIGLLLGVQNVGFILSVSLSGALADTTDKPKILVVGSLILGFSFLTFYLIDLFWLNLIIIFLIGVGMATYEGVTDALLLDIHTERESLHINVNHFFVTFGSIMITVYLIFLGLNWRASLIQAGGVVLLLAGFFALTKIERKAGRVRRFGERIRLLSRERVIVALFVATVLAVGVEIGSIGILTTFLVELRGFTQTASKIGLVIFLSGVATGRLGAGFFTPKEQISQFILVLFGLAGLFFAALYFLNLGRLTVIAVFLAGVSLSALLPLMITLAGLLYKDMAGTVMGVIKVAAPLGGILISFLMSILARYVSLQVALVLFPAAFWLAFLVLVLEIRGLKPLERAEVT